MTMVIADSPLRNSAAMRARVRRGAIALLAIVGLTLAAPLAASADSYRYWGYYQWDGDAWTFAQTGPAENIPADGDVDGWRFHVADESSTRMPRADGDFDLICGADEAADGMKRVAVVIDYGTDEDAPDSADDVPLPRGGCAVVDERANSHDVLVAVSSVRVDGGLTCAIGDYPATGCGEPVEGDAPSGDEDQVELALPRAGDSPDADSDGGGVPVGLLVGIGAVAVLGTAAFAATRRSRAE
jgi:hypothetical protein